MGKTDKAEKKSKKDKQVTVVEVVDEEGDVSMVQEATAVEVVKEKVKKEKEERESIVVPIEELSPIAHPLAGKKLVKKLHKTVKKASKVRQVKRGVKEVVKSIRKGEKGLLILAADITPIDIISHLPVMAEDASIPYVFVASKEELGQASSTKRPTSCVLICPDAKKKKKKVEGQEGMVESKDDDYRELYDQVHTEVKTLDEQLPRWFPKFLPNHHDFVRKTSQSTALSRFPTSGLRQPSIVTAVTANMPSAAAASKKDQKKSTAVAEKTSGPNYAVTAPKADLASIATTVEEVPRVTGGRPDQLAFNAQQEVLKKEIDGLQSQLSAVKEKIASLGKGGPANERRNELKAELDTLRGQQAGQKSSRSKIMEELKGLQEENQKKIKDLQASKSKLPFKTVQDVDNQIKKLDGQVESGNMKIADEKRALNEISQLRRSRKTVEGFQADEEAIQANKAKIEELKKELDDPEAKAISDRFDTIKKELDEIKKEQDEAYASRNKIFDERNELSAKLDELFQKKRDSNAAFREANDRYFAKIAEDRARRAERYKRQREQEEVERRREQAKRIREEAEIPAFQVEIEDCQTLIDLFTGKISGAAADTQVSTSKSKSAGLANVPELSIRQVEADPTLVALKKKGQEEENYFVAKKKKPAGKSNAQAPAAAPKEKENKPEDRFQVSFSTLTALGALSIPPPSSNADVERCIADLQKKRDWYLANQKRVTAEKIAKADAEIAKLEAQAGDANGHAGDLESNGNDETAAAEPTGAASEEVDEQPQEETPEEAKEEQA
ncbi:Patatin-like phospholipase domain containing protein [Ceratobasidium theobromae]|uniref:Patatin-like phospholipase domain containing protein n=1 Tax=Ceratobasidium theobromae TaxID=1582974 RepID=A0A5N5QWQ1_9AGAM|nr:Patatin-like phospholipase domain containing protein [Ceratobasidium theobromae]